MSVEAHHDCGGGDPPTMTQKTVTCAVCGKLGTVEIDEKTRAIFGPFIYFGDLLIDGKRVDYWECQECCEKESVNHEINH